MSVYRFVLTILILTGFLSCGKKFQGYKKYNILFISVDDLRPELGCYGVNRVHSPNIDALASKGTLFENAYCQMAWCSPSRVSLFTGLRPDETEVYDLKAHFRMKNLDIITLPQYFKDNGYYSAAVGKVYHNDPDLQDSLSWSRPAWLTDHPNPILAYALAENLSIAKRGKYPKSYPTEKAEVPDNAYPDGQVADSALSLINFFGTNEIPFFLAVGFYKPHLPFTAPAKYWDLYDPRQLSKPSVDTLPQGAPQYLFRSWSEPGSYYGVIGREENYSDSLANMLRLGYHACVSFIDAQVGKLLQALDKNGLSDNTIVVIWGDHGFKLGEYGRWSKHSNLEVDTRTPMIVYVPSEDINPSRTKAIVESIDIYPTLCELAGLSLPGSLSGQSLVPVMRKQNSLWNKPAVSQIDHEGYRGYSLRTPNYRYTKWFKQGQTIPDSYELYDFSKGAMETVNIYDQAPPGLVASLDSLLNQFNPLPPIPFK